MQVVKASFEIMLCFLKCWFIHSLLATFLKKNVSYGGAQDLANLHLEICTVFAVCPAVLHTKDLDHKFPLVKWNKDRYTVINSGSCHPGAANGCLSWGCCSRGMSWIEKDLDPFWEAINHEGFLECLDSWWCRLQKSRDPGQFALAVWCVIHSLWSFWL